MSMYPGEPVSVELVLDAGRRLVIRKSAADPAARARLRHEHAVLDHFRHPGAVAVASFADDSETTALALQWAGPRTLTEISSPTIEEAAGVIAALATTVADAHDCGIVHGRLDLSHVIIDESGRPVVCGWGGATFVGPKAQPEGVDRPADDVASLGQLLTGLVGFGGDLEPIPERWRPFRRQQRWLGYQRRALLTLADQATAPDARVRPTARRLAAAITETIPGADGMPLSTELESSAGHNGDDAAARDEKPLASSPFAAIPATTAVPAGQGARPHDPRSTPSGDRDEPLTSPVDTQRIDHRPPAAGVIGSRSGAPADDDRTPPRHDVQPVHRRRRERWLGRHGRRRRWIPTAAVGLVAVLTAVAIVMVFRSRPSTVQSSSRRVVHAARPAQRAHSASAPRNSTPATTAPSPAGRHVLSPTGTVGPSARTSTATSVPPDCHVPSGAVADVNGDGCPEPVHIVGNVLITPLRELAAGQQGDKVVLGDWWCHGRVTPAVLRPATGQVFVFARWPQPGADITVTPATTVPGATGINVDHRGSCDVIRVQRAGQGPVEARVPREDGSG